MTTIVLDKKNFGNIMWNLYNMIQKKPKNGLVITIDEDVERIWETAKNKKSYSNRKASDYFTLEEMKQKYAISN